ncbi:PEP/pyruvate-binding domain-containing protein [Rhodocyclus purpureus]|uniref:PEP/pyruvate-binding domain-containing protein n=1 Tax=Rhodocyclus purpureus TaxID=1067 RepID=UPI001911400F|nr:PEP/pyruvate-binding domain-containing protein [Rhodocyclus purpureus]MBK5913843.1 pyruvate, phosphate dikinase [Rhodocyclus purpureus]
METASSFTPTTGLAGLDAVLRGVQRGDNIVWQIESLDAYAALVERYAAAARRQAHRLIYFRFAAHAPLLAEGSGAEIHTLRPADGFDAFVDQVHSVIEAAGPETWYVFDCLSELAEAWQSDRMMGNFFRLTCPRLFDLDTVTYFGVYRNKHAPSGMQTIIDTTQFLLDVFRCRERLYIRPIKVQHRSAAAMNLIHAWEEGDRFRPVRDSGTVSEILAGSGWRGLDDASFIGHWRRHFATARAVVESRRLGHGDAEVESFWFRRLARLLFPQDAAMAPLIERHLRLEDLFAVRERMIGNGSIGGKALGMLLARAILRSEAPQLFAQLEAHDSFYVGTEVFDTFLVRNGLWWIRRQQSDPATFLHDLDEAQERIMQGSFTRTTLHQFEDMLDYFGEWPFIVRSSSRLEDLYGNAFAGQYESVFCANRGPREERLAELLDAVRRVYASSLGEKALRYRERRGLLAAHEQMALLIMRVSGSAGGRYFHPHAAGVGLSFNPYRWNPKIDMNAGVVRLVAGLGTRAVDRSDDDYTRLVALNAPELRPDSNFGAIARVAQRRMDAIDLEAGALTTGPFAQLTEDASDFPFELFTTREEAGRPAFLTFDGLLQKTSFVADMRQLLACLHAAYRHPVEIEFALNVVPGGGQRINLLQCRPMQVRNVDGSATVEPPADLARLVSAQGAVIGPSRVIRPDRIVHVTPAAYAALNQSERLSIARLIGRINRASAGRTLLVLGPGRWGSSDPWLGIPVTFSEINHVAALCEIVAMHAHLIPDVSLGTHFINELIEAEMLYFALFPERAGNLIDAEAIRRLPNRLCELLPEAGKWSATLHVADVEPGSLVLYADSEQQRVVVTAAGSPGGTDAATA